MPIPKEQLDELLKGGVRMRWEDRYHHLDANRRLAYRKNGDPFLLPRNTAVITDLANDAYHGERDYVSSSALKVFMSNPKKYKRIYVDRDDDAISDPSPEMEDGSLVHCLLLEPENFDNLYEIHDQGPDGEPFNARLKLHREWRDKNEEISGKRYISTADVSEASMVMASIGDNPLADALISNACYKELSLFCVHQESSVRIKAKLDLLTVFENRPTIIDVKNTSADGSPEGFSTTLARLGYDISAALYSLAFQTVTGVMPRFIWCVIEKDDNGDHQSLLHELRQADMMLAVDEVRHQLGELTLTTFSEFESPYSNKVNPVSIPGWRLRSRRSD